MTLSNPQGTITVTATRRLARHRQQMWDRQAMGEGQTVWTSRQVMPWSGWLASLWDFLLDHADTLAKTLPRQLTPYQEQCLWEEVLVQEGLADGLMDVTAAARLAMAADHLLRRWGLSPEGPEFMEHGDSVAFLRWRQQVEARLRQERWLSSADVAHALASRAAHLPVPATLELEGFDEMCPADRRLLAALRARGGQVVTRTAPVRAGRACRMPLKDQTDEIRAAAHWARHHAEHGEVGVVVADLASLRGDLHRIFLEVLDPPRLMAGGVGRSSSFELSLGEPLAAWPMTRDALFLLSLSLDRELEVPEYGSWLSSPFWQGGVAETMARAQLDAWLRQRGRFRISPQVLMTQDFAEHSPPLLVAVLNRLAGASRETSGLPSQWVERFSQELTAWGWPGDRALDSESFQLMKAWREMLTLFRGMDGILPVLSRGEALRQVRRLAGETLFQPESREPPVRVMGVLEATGMTFGALWLLGFTEESWPPVASPNPFLPAAWQRQHQLPRAGADRERALAEYRLQRLLASADTVVVGHPLRDGDREVRTTPLARHLPAQEQDARLAPSWTPATLEVFRDWQGPVLPDQNAETGGSGLFQSQAVCPFQAFARYRLGVTAMPDPRPAPDAALRGSLLHHCFEAFWGLVASKEALLAMTVETLQQVSRQAASQAVAWLAAKHPDLLEPAFQAMEIRRLQDFLISWTSLEAKREVGFQVLDREQETSLAIGGLQVRLRPDRVDHLSRHGLAVLDYKTGRPRVAGWFAPRLEEPQLPLYGLLRRETVDVLAFAVARPDEMVFDGVARWPGLLPGVKEPEEVRANTLHWNWSQLLDHWQQALTNLALEFRQGRADPAPLNRVACERCDLARLCRLAEQQRNQEEMDELS